MKEFYIILLLLLFFFLTVPISYAQFVYEQKVILGEMPYTILNSSISQFSFFKPVHSIPADAFNIKILDSDGTNLNFTRYSYIDYHELLDYFKRACSPDEEGLLLYDEGWAYHIGNATFTIPGGACKEYKSRLPHPGIDVILINKTGISLPVEFYTVEYEQRKKYSNGICVRNASAYITTFVLYNNAYIWNYTGNATIRKNKYGQEELYILNPEINGSVCFSYGTNNELESIKNRSRFLISIYAVLIMLLLTIFLWILNNYFNKHTQSNLLFFVAIIILGILYSVFIHPIFSKIISPIKNNYLIWIRGITLIFLLAGILCTIIIRARYKKCNYCNKIFKQLKEHIMKCPKTDNNN